MSQQGTEQNASAVRGRLHVDTLHAQYELANGSSFLQLEQRFQNDRSALIPTLAWDINEAEAHPLAGAHADVSAG